MKADAAAPSLHMLQPSSLSSHSSSPSLQTFFQKFDLFADAPGAVAKMRDLVLNLAVKGKLSENTDGWTKSPLGEVSRLRRGYDLPKQDRKQGSVPIFAANGTVGFHETHMVKGPGVVTGRSGSIGKVHFINEDFWPLNTALYVEDFFGNYPQFISLLLRSLHLDRFSTATAVPTLNRNVVHKEIVKVPPLAEQKRIVGKVDELMALCDRLEAQQQERETRHAVLARAALVRFADAPTPANLDFLFHSSFSIQPSDLRKSILTLAVQGKLVPQDPNDEPAEELLVRSLAERRNLKRTDVMEVQALSGEDTLGYDIPESWRWQRLDDLLIFGPTNGFSPKAVDYETPVRSLTLSATTSGRFKGEHSKFITTDVPAHSDLWLRDGDILVQRGNTIAYVGVAAVYRGEPNQFVYPDLMMKLRVSSAFDVDFIHLAMSHEAARDFLRARASGTSGSMPKINQTTLRSMPLPVPPVAEQRRIVAKVEQLMALVDALETQLAASRATAVSLLSALVSELTAQV
jgi:type I restriction enzyme S subunit